MNILDFYKMNNFEQIFWFKFEKNPRDSLSFKSNASKHFSDIWEGTSITYQLDNQGEVMQQMITMIPTIVIFTIAGS